MGRQANNYIIRQQLINSLQAIISVSVILEADLVSIIQIGLGAKQNLPPDGTFWLHFTGSARVNQFYICCSYNAPCELYGGVGGAYYTWGFWQCYAYHPGGSNMSLLCHYFLTLECYKYYMPCVWDLGGVSRYIPQTYDQYEKTMV